MEVESCTMHDAGEYTFVPEGYTQSLSAKVHIIGTKLNKYKSFFGIPST